MSNEQLIIPEKSSYDEIKLNFKNFFSFLSSLDYLRFLEKEGAFKNVKSENLYYVQEKMELMHFVFKHIVFWINIEYFAIILFGYFIFKQNFLFLIILFAFSYFALGIWFVHRYTIGRGYLYLIVKDFLFYSGILAFMSSLVWEIILMVIVPVLWKLFEAWLFDPSSKEGFLNQVLYEPSLIIYNFLKPHIYNLFGLRDFIKIYFALTPVKLFVIFSPYLYFLYYSKKKENEREEMFKKLA